MMQTLATQIPSLEKLTQDIEAAADKKVKYAENMKVSCRQLFLQKNGYLCKKYDFRCLTSIFH